MAFHLLSSTAENFLTPALAKLSNIIGCTETLAGVTLVAFGNGAPDVLTAITAGGGPDPNGIEFVIGSIFGAGLFVTTITSALVISNAGGIKLNPRMFLRDTLFYLAATSLILIYGAIGYIKWQMAIFFLCIYIFFICFVVFDERNVNKCEKDNIMVND